jgi:glycosyltransferase involved in cell wall biosynthesis
MTRSLPSIKRQTYRSFECLVVSDGYEVETARELKELHSQDRRFIYLPLPEHKGGWGAPCRTFGAHYAKGEIVAYLDDDNAWRENHLELLDNAFQDLNVDFAFTQMKIVVTGQVVGSEPKVGFIDSSIMAHRRGTLERYGNWPQEDATYVQDGETAELWARSGARWSCVPQVTVDYYTDSRR